MIRSFSGCKYVGPPFDMVLPTIAEAVGSHLGTVVEVEKRQKLDGQSFFMRVKVAIPITKPIRKGAFLIGSDGKSNCVIFKYKRLPLFCHHCGLLGHDLRHYASYFALTKNGVEVACQYGDWLKATGSRSRSPPHRDSNKEEVLREDGRGEDWNGQGGHRAMATDGYFTANNPREQGVIHMKGNNGNVGTDLEVRHEKVEIKGIGTTDKEGVGLGSFDTKATLSNSNMGESLDLEEDPMHMMVAEFKDGPQGPKARPKWTRLTRMEYGFVELIKEGAKLILGKRIKGKEESSLDRDEQDGVVKRGKIGDDSNHDEMAGVPVHPCRVQRGF